MKYPLHISKSLPAWQLERANILQRICRHLEIREKMGRPLKKPIRLAAWRWNGKPLRKNPSRRLRLGRVTIYRLYRHWQRNGQVPSAFYRNYKPCGRRFPARILVRFIEFVADHDFSSFKEAWQAFCKQASNRGCGLVFGKPLNRHYGVVIWNLPPGFFRGIKRQRDAMRTAQRDLSAIRIRAIAHLESGQPMRILKARKPLNWEI